MVNWVVITVIIIAVVLFYKFTAFRYERFWTYLIAIVMIFVLFTFFTVVKKNDIDISSVGGFLSGVKFYGSWALSFGKHAASITGNVAKVDWAGNFTDNKTASGVAVNAKGWR